MLITWPFVDFRLNIGLPDVDSLRSYLPSSGALVLTDSMPLVHPDLAECPSLARMICPLPAFNLNLNSPALSLYSSINSVTDNNDPNRKSIYQKEVTTTGQPSF